MLYAMEPTAGHVERKKKANTRAPRKMIFCSKCERVLTMAQWRRHPKPCVEQACR